MKNALKAEFLKLRHKKIWILLTALSGIQLLWAFWQFRRIHEEDLYQAWQMCLYQFPVLNALIMPLTAAVLASRLSDTEHKGQTFKLLEIIMPSRRLFDAKFLCGALHILGISVFQFTALLVWGLLNGFPHPVPWEKLGCFLLFTCVVSLTLYLVQMILSLLFANQLIPLVTGLFGGFIGLFLLFLPPVLSTLLPWGYYGVLMIAGLSWNSEARVSRYYWLQIDWTGFAVLTGAFFIIYMTGRTLFAGKEL